MFICLQYKIEKKEESEEEDEYDDMMMSKKKVEEVDPIARESFFLINSPKTPLLADTKSTPC